LAGFGLDAAHREGGELQILLEGLGLVALADVEAGDLLAVRAHEAARSNTRPLGGAGVATMDQYSCGLKVSISSSRSQDEAQGHRLHAARRERAPGSLRHRPARAVKPTR
jgi:hypothetical protein